MTNEYLKHARDVESRIYRLKLMIKNIETHPAFVNDSDIREAPEITEAVKALLLPDLRARLAAEEAAFAAL